MNRIDGRETKRCRLRGRTKKVFGLLGIIGRMVVVVV